MSFLKIILAVLLGGVASMNAVAAEPDAKKTPPEVRVTAGALMIPRLRTIKDQFEKVTGAKLNILGGDGVPAESGLASVDSGAADVCFMATRWEDMIQLSKERNYEFKNFKKLKYKEIAKAKVYFITNKSGPEKLTQEQIKDLMTGKIKNWKEIGGADVPVAIAIPSYQHAIQKLIKDKYFGGVDFQRSSAQFFNKLPDLIDFVEKNPGAISFGMSTISLDKVKNPDHPVIENPLNMITLGEPTSNILKLVELLTPNGKIPANK